MKRTLCAAAAIAGLLFANIVNAQEPGDLLSISNRGVSITHKDPAKKAADSLRRENRSCDMSYAMVDIGMTVMMDNTNYADPKVTALLDVPASRQNKSLFDLRTSKSVNVNIYPWMIKFKALKTHSQRIYISTGVGLQLYNFRYEDPITYTRNPVGVIIDTVSFKKNKLAIDNLSIPLMFTFKTRLPKDNWLVYGFGVSEGFRLASWTKQISGPRGKVKVFDQFGLNDLSTCISGEIGLEGAFRLFATYQVTSLFQNGIDQHPVTIGFRIGGI